MDACKCGHSKGDHDGIGCTRIGCHCIDYERMFRTEGG